MSLADHLIELKRRLMIGAAAVVVAMIAAFFITEPVMHLITEPIRMLAAERGEQAAVELMYTSVTGAFDLRMRMAFAIGFLLSAPIWIWQIWAYIMPAMTKREKRYTVGFIAAAVPLFFAGCATGLLVMPNIVKLMAEFLTTGASAMYDANYYYDFVFKLMLFVGVAYIVPVFLIALNFAGVLTGKAILSSWRVAVLISVIFACIATPPADVATTFLITGILLVLYFAAAGLAMLLDHRRAKRAAALSPSGLTL
ncbi:twin-arginine translocase subunit TatC [Microbacterium sp. zg.Y625]|uniref:twin-arginine translocase subunit TatC n=1 Tax=Microbacterium jiangjiandongii TaxID=3049071 RepID=UPI00214BD796|nr:MULTISPECIES: twin-arginine translocase subunit TatC [unclassified Microbacterium]MCR2792595.1 twin-arginine translocase subunit TatC [Microbacterium sp. zg.Y625]MCR2814719.1 twin-arginine translocase subunit TatC [Microbacterium sp. zg.Y843]WIM26581.1 twin-arginine translocase subunit TatC [Microbacterium sp. zg-Y625]